MSLIRYPLPQHHRRVSPSSQIIFVAPAAGGGAQNITLAERGVGSENLGIAVTLADSGSVGENLVVDQPAKTLADSGTVSDDLLRNAVTLTDSGSADDNLLA